MPIKRLPECIRAPAKEIAEQIAVTGNKKVINMDCTRYVSFAITSHSIAGEINKLSHRVNEFRIFFERKIIVVFS
ncbi:hypothetical protein [Labilibaculum sp.]|uniref:hypothetical protein n=1 Tax=Labilibaculum sp. TaxID=2060723 RepID=UPI00356A79C8